MPPHTADLLDPAKLRAAASLYDWCGDALGDFQWTDAARLRYTGEYLIHWAATHYWNPVLAGGVRGYSLLLHEWSERKAYEAAGLDPMNLDAQTGSYYPMHARALLAEHRFLQTVALSMGSSFSLRELVEHNPHGDPPGDGWDGDWAVLSAELPNDLSRGDRDSDAGNTPLVREFYRRLGFERLN